jgi:hypothetical protein
MFVMTVRVTSFGAALGDALGEALGEPPADVLADALGDAAVLLLPPPQAANVQDNRSKLPSSTIHFDLFMEIPLLDGCGALPHSPNLKGAGSAFIRFKSTM